MKLITLLLLTSCGTNNLRTWHETKEYTEVGVRCAQDYYYSFKYGRCIYSPLPKDVPESKSTAFLPVLDVKMIKNKARHGKRLKTAKFDCSKLYAKLNQCSAVE